MGELSGQILIADNEKEHCQTLSHLAKKEGLSVLLAHDSHTALDVIRNKTPDVVVLDMKLPAGDRGTRIGRSDACGLEIIPKIKSLNKNLPIIVTTDSAKVSEAVEVVRAGACDYVAKPSDYARLIRIIRQVLEKPDAPQNPKRQSGQPQGNFLREAMGPSEAVGQLITKVNRVAESDFTVIILGETGSGKELIAQSIHQASPRSDAPFVPVDCGAIPETLLESELFGHEKGAFTGADSQRSGKFEAAQGGTLFLDEITNMPLGSQAKLLRVLQEKVLYRVGGDKPITTDARLVAASNLNLQDSVKSGSFRHDLFYRLNEFTITIPPLRSRREDILYLSGRFLNITNLELGKDVKQFSDSALNVLLSYHWPGNVRQLRSTIRRAVLLADAVITDQHLDIDAADMRRSPEFGMAINLECLGLPESNLSLKEILRRSINAIEREVIDKALKHTKGNKAKAARLLQIDYKTIYTKGKKFGIPTEGEEYEQKEV